MEIENSDILHTLNCFNYGGNRMKKFRRLVSLIIVSALVLCMNITAFAAEGDSVGQISDMTISEVVSYLESKGRIVDDSFVAICEEIVTLKEEGVSQTQILSEIGNMPSTYSLYDTWGKLTDSEKALCITHPTEAIAIQSNATEASSSTEEIYGYNGNGDTTDAYRHGYWNALNARDVGETIAEAFATAHEDVSDEELNKVSNGFYGWEHRSMDLHNNEVGRSVVNWNDWFTSDETMSSRILEQIEKGNMVILVK